MSKKILNILLILTTFFTYYVFINPLYSGMGGVFSFGEGVKTLKNKKAEYDSAVMEADKLVKDAQEKVEAYDKLSEEERERMSVMLPESVDTIRLMHEISMLSITSGMPVSNLAVSESEPASNGKGVVTVNLSVKSSYAKFKEFMKVIENSMRLFSVKSVTFNAPETDGEPVTFNVILETYYLP